jgi:hypothetical protein
MTIVHRAPHALRPPAHGGREVRPRLRRVVEDLLSGLRGGLVPVV